MSTQLGVSARELTAGRTPGLKPPTLLMIALAGVAALAVVTPFFFLGNASGHDFEFHLASWMDVARQWRAGILYPRWAELANWGYGEPRFIFYPPASWMLGAALSFIFPWSMVPGTFIWLALTLAGITMFSLARQWLPTSDALAAGVLFAINPYHLVLVYWRSDFAEMLASALIPLAVLFAMRTATQARRAWLPLALVTAAFWLCNAPAAVVLSYTTALILVVVAVQERSIQPVMYGAAALGLGLALAAFYVVPAAFEQSWVNISEVLSQGLKFPENFLFTITPDADHTSFNFIVSWVAVGTIGATVAAMAGSPGRLRREHSRLWWVLVVVAAVSVILMFPVTTPVWTYLPKLRYVQFPWRWLLVLDVPYAFCLAAAMGRLRGAGKHAAWAMALAGLAFTGFLLTRSNWWDPGGATDFYEEHFSTGAGYFGVDEYGPRGSDHYDLDQKAPLVGLNSADNVPAKSGSVEAEQWAPLRKRFVVHSPQPVTAGLRLLNYPAWRVEVNDKPASVFSNPQTGQMLLSLPAGESWVRITFAAMSDRLCGDAVSMAAAILLAGLALASRRRAAGRHI